METTSGGYGASNGPQTSMSCTDSQTDESSATHVLMAGRMVLKTNAEIIRAARAMIDMSIALKKKMEREGIA